MCEVGVQALVHSHYFLRTFIVPTTCVILPDWDIERVLDLVPKYVISVSPLCTFIDYWTNQTQGFVPSPRTISNPGNHEPSEDGDY